jgi:predicted kinase
VAEARLILTCGLPGAGKTTLARRLAAERGALRLTTDEWMWALGSTPWDESLRVKVEHELWRTTQDVLRLNVSVVLDFGLWARVERDELRLTARQLGVGVELHYLETSSEDLWRRIEERNAVPPWIDHPIHRSDLESWLQMFQAPDSTELDLFDPPPVEA